MKSIATRKSSEHALNDLFAQGIDRRQLLSALAMLVAVSTVSKAKAATCASPQGADAGLRESLHYVESSLNPAQRCSGCSFFSDPKGDCGSCMIFSAPANINGHCDSWSPRS
jgi:High potential iron-sulfur protein